MRLPLLALLALGCSDRRPEQFDCGKVICLQEEICLHWETPDTAPPDAGHACVAAPATCGAEPTCDCAAEVCLEDCEVDQGLSCWGEDPQ